MERNNTIIKGIWKINIKNIKDVGYTAITNRKVSKIVLKIDLFFQGTILISQT